MVERIPYVGQLPDSFFTLAKQPYASLPYAPEEDAAAVRQLINAEACQHEIIIYTDHQNIRLAGLFPYAGEVAYFGFWETANKAEVNSQAFALLAADAACRGKKSIVGPLHFSTYHRYRLRLGATPGWQQFDREPVNPIYYPGLIQAIGFESIITFESQLLRAEAVPRVYLEKKPVLEKLSQAPFDFIPINAESWPLLADDIFQLIHEIFRQNPAYKAVSRAQFDLLYNVAYAAKLCPHSSVLFREKGSGKLVAISLCHPNYFGLHLPSGASPDFERDYHRLRRKTLLAKTVGVHPDFRQGGLQNLLAAYAMLSFREYYEEVVFCLMRADNYSLRFTDGMLVEKAYYALFERQL